MFAERLRLLRENNKLKQSDLASILNISTPAYGFYEQKKREPTFETLINISNYYNVSTDYLLGITDAPGPIEQKDFFLERTSLVNPKNPSPQEISEDERALIEYYNRLGDDDKRWIVGQMIDLNRKSNSRESESANTVEVDPKHA